MGYKDNIVPGWVPHSGAIFASNIGTKKECFRQKLFGLPSAMSNFVLHVKKGMILFLFEFERRQLFGVFRAISDGEINIVPNAFKSSGRHFPAQVRFTSVWNCNPLDESEFRDAIRDNYFSGKRFNFGLSEDQVYKLMMLFHTKRIPKNHPERNIRKYGDKPAEEDGRFDDHRTNRDGRFDDQRTNRDGRFDDHRTNRDGRFDDHRTNLFRDRLGFISKEDTHGLDICKYLEDEDKEVDDHVYLNAKFVEEVNNFNCSRGQRNRTVTEERLQEYNGDRFLTNYKTQSDDFGDHSTSQAILGNHLDHPLGGLRRVADAGMHDVNDVHHNLGEIRGITNEDRFFMMEKIKVEHDIEDDRHIFTEPHGKHFGKIGAASSDAKFLIDGITSKSKEFVDDNRTQDEYHVINNFWQTINDGRLFGYESEQGTLIKQEGTDGVWIKPNYDEGSTFRSRTYSEHPLFRPTAAGKKPRYDYKDFGFGDVSPTHSSIRDVVSTNYIAFSHCKQNTLNSSGNPISEVQDSFVSEQLRHPSECSNIGKTYDCNLPYSTCCDTRMITMPIPYDEAPDIRLRPSSFAAGPSSSLVDNCPFYPSSKDALLGKNHETVSCHETRGTHLVEGNRVFKTDTFEGSYFSERSLSLSQVETAENFIKGHRSCGFSSRMSLLSGYDNSYLGEPRSKYIHEVSESSLASKKVFLSDAGLCSREDDPIRYDKIFRQPREDKCLDEPDKRVSVFARLRLAPEAARHEKELDSDEHENRDASINNDMNMLEKIVSGPIKRSGKSISAFKHDDDIIARKIVDYDLSKVKMEPDADLADETIEGGSGSILHETRLVDFKRRKRANKNLDDKSKENTAGPVESERSGNTVSEPDVGSVETNSLIGMPGKRRRLVRPVFVINESTADAKNPLPTSNENTPLKDDSNPTKAVESLEKVEASIESVQVSAECQKDVIEGEASSEVGGDGNAENDKVLDGNERERPQKECDVVDGITRVGSPKDDRKMCGWIEW
ncbi:hypothetical protein L6452_09799 [Arctium lappa]|uniref:Uncharacterized protein n=1 Tax=Arctium lappa TaxID=4217 RepID=A0ACB9DLC9_ARCLA|nr:hypothetical protein L6452_09799 [Arctium lappa]